MSPLSFTDLHPIIFTDLDGTLLHPETYSFDEALPALDLIRKRNIPLILCTSKTRAELMAYLGRLSVTHPFISENGGGIFIPTGYFSNSNPEYRGRDVIVLGTRYEQIRNVFNDLKQRLQIRATGFGDMSLDAIADLTGLSVAEVGLARQREFSEPFLFNQDADERLLQAIEEEGYTWTKGELYCLMGQHDKGKAVRILKRLYENEHGKIISIGLGDAMNDLPLLQEVEVPVLIQKNDGSYDPGIEVSGLTLAPGIGPSGWNKILLDLLTL